MLKYLRVVSNDKYKFRYVCNIVETNLAVVVLPVS